MPESFAKSIGAGATMKVVLVYDRLTCTRGGEGPMNARASRNLRPPDARESTGQAESGRMVNPSRCAAARSF